MAWKASKDKILKEKSIKIMIAVTTIYPCFLLCSLVIWDLLQGHGNLIHICLDSEHVNSTFEKLPIAIYVFQNIFIFGIGLFCDVKMYLFVKNTNKVHRNSSNLVPWKSIGKKTDEEDSGVPLRTTIFSSVYFLISITLPTPIGMFLFNSENYWNFLIFLSVLTFIPFPSILIFSIKRKTDDQSHNQPPSRLQFHDETPKIIGISHPLQFHEDFDHTENSKEQTVVSPLPFSATRSKNFKRRHHQSCGALLQLNAANLLIPTWVAHADYPNQRIYSKSNVSETFSQVEC